MKPLLISLVVLFVLIGCEHQTVVGPESSAPTTESLDARTFVLNSADDARLPAPMMEEDAATMEEREFVKSALRSLGGPHEVVEPRDPASTWNMMTRSRAISAQLPPPLFSRAYTLVHVAIYDALVAAHTTSRRDLWDRAVAAGAATAVLNYLFPGDSAKVIMKAVPEELKVDHGYAFGRVIRSWVLGRRVGALVVAHGMADGSDTPFTDTIPVGPGLWTGTDPVLPMAGTWETWITTSGTEFEPEAPYVVGTHQDSIDIAAVEDAAANRTTEQLEAVFKWADGSPPAIWNKMLRVRVERDGLGQLASARAFAYLNIAMYDGFVASWNTKYRYWTARPFERIPGLVTVIPTPNFPSYTSGHSTIAAAAAEVLGLVFPDEASFFADQAHQAAMSRLWSGVQFPHGNTQGETVGHKIGQKVTGVMGGDAHAPIFAGN